MTIALIATRKGLFSLDSDLSLQPLAFLGVPVSFVLAGKTRKFWYAALDHGHFGVKLHRSEDKGKTWQEVSVPKYPVNESAESNTDAKAESQEANQEASQSSKDDSLSLIWSLAYSDDKSSDTLWAGTIPGGLFYSGDGGDSWQLNESLWQKKCEHGWFGGGFDQPGIHSICVDPRNSNEIKVAISCGGVWVSTDKGQSWNNQSEGMRAEYMPPDKAYDPHIQDPHLMVQCLSAPDTLWVQHHNGIFRSTDNAKTWHEFENVSPSAFGFAVAVDPTNPDCAWFVPGIKDECRIPVNGKFVVTRTLDGGESFESIASGLSSEPSSGLSYDLVFRHGLSISDTGEGLLMGSTTGNLWYSSDKGSNWHIISHHLPPIFAVSII